MGTSFINKGLAAVYKDILHTDNGNTGIATNIKQITCGDGDTTALYLSNRNFKVQPSADTTTNTAIYDADGNALFVIDSSNDTVKAGIGQHTIGTQYAHFGVNSTDGVWAGALANTHYAVPFINTGTSLGTIANVGFGTSTNPSTSLTISDSAHDIIQTFWYVMDNITVDRVVWWSAGDASTGDTSRAHLMSYDVETTAGSTSGDLSSGTVVADGSDITNAGYEQAYYQQLSISSANVNAGKVILFTHRTDSVNSDYTINATVKFHLR